jgi:hypothetical protein
MRRSSTELAHGSGSLYIHIYIDVSTDNVCLSVLFTIVRERRAVCAVCCPMENERILSLRAACHHVYI